MMTDLEHCDNCSKNGVKFMRIVCQKKVDNLLFEKKCIARKCVFCGADNLTEHQKLEMDLLISKSILLSGHASIGFVLATIGTISAANKRIENLLGLAPGTISSWREKRSVPTLCERFALLALVNDRLAGVTATTKQLDAMKAGESPRTNLDEIGR